MRPAKLRDEKTSIPLYIKRYEFFTFKKSKKFVKKVSFETSTKMFPRIKEYLCTYLFILRDKKLISEKFNSYGISRCVLRCYIFQMREWHYIIHHRNTIAWRESCDKLGNSDELLRIRAVIRLHLPFHPANSRTSIFAIAARNPQSRSHAWDYNAAVRDIVIFISQAADYVGKHDRVRR